MSIDKELDLSMLDDPSGVAGCLDFLTDEMLRGIDSGAASSEQPQREAVQAGQQAAPQRDDVHHHQQQGAQLGGSSGEGPSGVEIRHHNSAGGEKRGREIVSDGDSDPEGGRSEGNECSASRCKGEPVGGGGGSGESLKVPRSKACREKARRERINERFAELAKLCDPEDPKSDKASILTDGIKIITQLKAENGQLHQLNKFLEERVAQYDKEKGQQLYQQSLMMQAVQPVVQPPAFHSAQVAMGTPIGGVGVGPSALQPSGCPLVGVQPPHANMFKPEDNSGGTAMGTPVVPNPSTVSNQPGFPPSASMTPVLGFQPSVAWASCPESVQTDQILRPPAA